MLSPRRYGKTSLIHKVLIESKRDFILLDLQLITSAQDLAEQMLKRIYRVFPFERLRQIVKQFRIIPSLAVNPVTNETSVSFGSVSSSTAPLEDVIDLLDKLGSQKNKLIVVFDEFQDIRRIGADLDAKLRSLMQYHKNVNYVFLGSQESLIRELFEKKKSPFYHFGYMLPLGKIKYAEFHGFLSKRFESLSASYSDISDQILLTTDVHPYYTQQLAFTVWNLLMENPELSKPVEAAVNEIVTYHDMDYERLWNTLISTDRKIMIGIALADSSPLSDEFGTQFGLRPVSTIYSGIKRLLLHGYVCKTAKGYEIDDPFFRCWIIRRRD